MQGNRMLEVRPAGATAAQVQAAGELLEDTAGGNLAQEMVATVRHFVRLVFKLFGAAEDIGLSLTSTAFCQCAMKRQTLDGWTLKVFHFHRGPGEWSSLLLSLEPRDRLRFLSMGRTVYVNWARPDRHGRLDL